jgi:hypothetical protein
MRRTIVWALLLAPAVGFLAGCQSARAGVGQPRAFIYKHTTVPFTTKRTRGELNPGLQIPQNPRIGEARWYGVAINIPFVGPIPTPGISPLSVGWGDASLEAAMANGNIQEVIYGDAEELEILNGLFTKVILRVYGENPESVTSARGGE